MPPSTPETKGSQNSIPKYSDTKSEVTKIIRSGPFLAIAFVTGNLMTRAGTRATLVPLQADEALGCTRSNRTIFTVTGIMTSLLCGPLHGRQRTSVEVQ